MDIDILVLVQNYTGSGYELGDIVEVSRRGTSPCRHPRFALLRINGVPDNAPPNVLLRRLRRTLVGSIEDNTILREPRIIRRRRWRLNRQSIPTAVKVAIRDNKEFTGTWTQLKNHVERRLVVVESDSSQDTFEVLTDADV